jgi:putative NADPH-quinone reductase
MNALVILAHPDLENGSTANRVIIDTLSEAENVEIRDLYKMYPTFEIDVESEQQALINADVIVFQFPFFWYSVPGMLKEWLDKVFAYGFAYGSTGDKLKGKEFLISTTVGGQENEYQEGGENNFTLPELLKPLQQTAIMAGMKFNKPLISYNMIYIPGVYNEKEDVEQRAQEHVSKLLEELC